MPALCDSPSTAMLADTVADLEAARIAAENRTRQLTRNESDADGGLRGFGLGDDNPVVVALLSSAEGLASLENRAVRDLEKAMRSHPLYPWVARTRGVGLKQAGRLLASIGDPYWHYQLDRPRTVSELRAYCGMHVVPARTGQSGDGGDGPGHHSHDREVQGSFVAPARTRGRAINWDATSRSRVYLIAVSCVKQPHTARFRAVYDAARAKYDDAVHTVPCARCGPSGSPAPTWSPLSAGHQHGRALRMVAREILGELHAEARDYHRTHG